MSFLTILFSPFNLLFFIIIAGFAIGKIRIYRISVGIAGILFVSILAGALMKNIIPEAHTDIISNVQNTMKIFSTLGTSLFVSVIGLQTGFSINSNSKGSLISFLTGGVMSFSGVVAMRIIAALDTTISYPTLLGVLCGALTSTPGLSSVCELIDNSEEAVWGYGCSYLLGVVFAVLFTQLFKSQNTCMKNQLSYKSTGAGKIYPGLILISLTSLFGNIFGSVYIPILNVSMGNTACILLIGLILGWITQKRFSSVQVSSQALNSFKNLGLALFFVGTGYSTGIQSVIFNVKTVIYGAVITLTAILCGLFLSEIVFSRYKPDTGCVIAGGMTSSPAYGSISSRADEASVKHFSFAYFGSLVTLVIAIQIIGR